MKHSNRKLRIGTLQLVFFLLLAAFIEPSFGQGNGCANLNFDQGTFTNWVGYTGNYNTCCPNQGIVSGRHTIITTSTTDPNTCGGLTTLPPGVPFAAKLGNDNVGAEAERLRYDLTVDLSNNLFLYRYAVVLEDPGHSPNDQPKFDLRILDANGNVVDPICGQYSVTSAPGLPGWNSCGSTIWKDWTTVGLDLSPLIGQQITIEFSTYDCDLGGHYGYAYIAASCGSSVINVNYCIGDTTVLLSAPDGFSGYVWSSGATTQSTVSQNPISGSTYSVTMTTVNGCASVLNTTVSPTIVTSDFSLSGACADEATFSDQTTVVNGTVSNWHWDFGDGTPALSGVQNPIHSYSAPGTYMVSLISETDYGCPDTIEKTITILESPIADYSANATCANQPITFSNNSQYNSGTLSSIWDFDDGTSSTAASPNHVFTSAGTYEVILIVTSNQTGCSDTVSQTLTLTDRPVPTFDPLPDLCESDPPIDLLPFTQSSQTGVSAFSGPGVINSTFDPAQNGGGTFMLSYTITSDLNGCDSTAQQTITVLPDPQPSFSSLPVLCIDAAPIDLLQYINPGTTDPNFAFSGPGVNGFEFDPLVSGVGIHSLSAFVENDLTKCSASITANIEVVDLPQISVPSQIQVCFNHSEFQLNEAQPIGGTYISSELKPGFVFDPKSLNGDVYSITYQYTDANNCTNEEVFEILIERDDCLCEVYIPNAFTPTGDLLNDSFQPSSTCSYIEYDMKIYNRWGELVFQSNDANTFWDGTHNGEESATGVYVYELTYIGDYHTGFMVPNTSTQVLRGQVTLIR